MDLVERYTKEQQLFLTDECRVPEYTKTITLDLAPLNRRLAGPKRPQDRIPLAAIKQAFQQALGGPGRRTGLCPVTTDEQQTTVDFRTQWSTHARWAMERW